MHKTADQAVSPMLEGPLTFGIIEDKNRGPNVPNPNSCSCSSSRLRQMATMLMAAGSLALLKVSRSEGFSA